MELAGMTDAARKHLSQAASEISDLLDRIGDAPHADFDGNGGLCPICGLVTKLRAALREELDALALREHVAAHPTPPSGPKVVTAGELSPPRTTVFRKPDGSPLIEITFTHTFSKLTRVRRRRDG